MAIVSQTPNMAPTDEDEAAAECDEPPGNRVTTVRSQHAPSYATTTTATTATSITTAAGANSKVKPKKESLLTRALLSSPELSPADRSSTSSTKWRTVPPFSIQAANHSGPSTAELTSDGELTTPPRSTTPSPPPLSQFTRPPWLSVEPASKPVSPVDEHELKLEADLGRKRCITFACASKVDPIEHTQSDPLAAEAPKRKSTIKFACPAKPRDIDFDIRNDRRPSRKPSVSIRGSRSPAPRGLQSRNQARSSQPSQPPQMPMSAPTEPTIPATGGSLKVTGLGKFEPSDATRFQEFGSSLEDEDWLRESSNYKQKMTLDDCMRKENVIRKLGEEVEAEAQEEAEQARNNNDDDDDDNEDENNEDDDEEDQDEDEDEDDDDGNPNLSDDGNESDNEAGFASSDDDGESDYAFWTTTTTAATSHSDTAIPPPTKWRGPHASIESLVSPGPFEDLTPKPKRTTTVKEKKSKSTTPSLPDSTDFVCGTLDEDRSIEVAYISRMEERRRQKHIPIPQDIDPSFPTSDPEDEDDEEADDNGVPAKPTTSHKQPKANDTNTHGEPPRGRRPSRTNVDKSHQAAPHSPRKLFGHSPRRLRSPPPPGRLRSPPPSRRTSIINPPNLGAGPSTRRINVALAERPNRTRTSSLPRTPNPFFARAYTTHSVYKRTSRSPSPSPLPKSSTTKQRTPLTHTRGPIDIVAGLEKKRQKRKEKFWRQHCRRAAKEQNNQRDRVVPGLGAERMKELGLEVAERFKGYGVGMGVGIGGNGPKLVLSI